MHPNEEDSGIKQITLVDSDIKPIILVTVVALLCIISSAAFFKKKISEQRREIYTLTRERDSLTVDLSNIRSDNSFKDCRINELKEIETKSSEQKSYFIKEDRQGNYYHVYIYLGKESERDDPASYVADFEYEVESTCGCPERQEFIPTAEEVL